MTRNRARDLDAIFRLLRSQSTLALSTVGDDGAPHTTPLFYLAEPEFQLFWFSSPSSRHSRNLAKDGRAAVAVYRSTEDWRKICGVQMQGKAEKILDRTLRRRITHDYSMRFGLGSLFRVAMARNALYLFRPCWIRYLDNRRRFGFKFEITFSPGDRVNAAPY
jgi:hypothetical protein